MSPIPAGQRSFHPQIEGLEERITPDASLGDPAHFQQLSALEQQYHQILQVLPSLETDRLQKFAEFVVASRDQLQSDVAKIQDRINHLDPTQQQEVTQFITQAIGLITQEQTVEQQVQKIVAAALAQLQQFGAQVVALDQKVAQEELANAAFFMQQQQNAAGDQQLVAFYRQLVQQAFDDISQATVDLQTVGVAPS